LYINLDKTQRRELFKRPRVYISEFTKGENMKTKFLLVSALLILATVLSACGPAAAQPVTRSLNVTGMGQIYLTPDIAYIYIGVHTDAASASEAVTQNTASTQKVVDALKKFGVAPEDIRTTNFSIWPSPQYDPDGKQIGTTYMVDNTVYVTVRDISKMGDLLDGVVKAGANSINSIQFDVADKTQALSDARKAAVENAKKQAQELADAAGVSLGAVQNISYYDSVPSPYYDSYGKGGMSLEAASVPVSPGQLVLSVTVTITYELK
jgi:hypothetical protein